MTASVAPSNNSTTKNTPGRDTLAALDNFPLIRQGPAPYFLKQTESEDELLRASGWIGVLDARTMHRNLHEKLLADCSIGVVRKRAVAYFEANYEHELAQRAAQTTAISVEDAAKRALEAQLRGDPAEQASAELANFLANGAAMHLALAVQHAEAVDGRDFAMEVAVRVLSAQPLNVTLALKLFRLLEVTRQPQLLDRLAELYAATGVLRHIGELTAALADFVRGDPSACLNRLSKLEENAAFKNALGPFKGTILKTRADALHESGAFPAAYRTTLELNAFDAAQTKIPAKQFYDGIHARNKLQVPALPPDQRTDTVQMLGFPRSGTTLLENVLAAHPLIETFEEIPSHNALLHHIETVLLKQRPAPATDVDLYLGAREAYYREVDVRRQKPEAQVLVDKMPIRSADAAFMKRVFPERRYIFSIRHPFDVVLSCLRQRFAANPAMENFHTIADSVRIYDFTLNQWFDTFGMDDPHVRYVKYDELVTSFEPVTRGVLTFLGVDWSDEVRDFAEKAGKRRAATPSYAKVRQGLSIGVQSAWRDYDFVFQTPEAKPLHRWAEFFGYETQ